MPPLAPVWTCVGLRRNLRVTSRGDSRSARESDTTVSAASCAYRGPHSTPERDLGYAALSRLILPQIENLSCRRWLS